MSQAYRRVLVLIILCVMMAGCIPTSDTPSSTASRAAQENFSLQVLTTALEHPWEIIFGPDGYLWVTERTGKRVTRVDPATGDTKVAITIPEAYQRTIHDGVLGMALHPGLLQDQGNDYVYLVYVYNAATSATVDRRATIKRYTYDEATQTLGDPVDLLTDLPASSDHNSGRLVFGSDQKLYYSLGDQGNNQFDNYCQPILAQELPTAAEVEAADWSHYVGKVLRLNLDGSIPADNPTLAGVQSHVYSYGHRNVQGLVMRADGHLYASEHGPKTDDEVNLIAGSQNYGWPQVAGYQDDKAYVYANWSAAPNCASLTYSDYEIPSSVPQQQESAWNDPNFTAPLYTFGTVDNEYNFQIEACAPNYYICWPTVAPSGIDLYSAGADGIPGWSDSLLVTALKTGTVYRMQLNEDGTAIEGEALPYFKTTNRYRDLAIHPDGRTFYVITDNDNNTQDPAGIPTQALENPGAILVFSYTGNE